MKLALVGYGRMGHIVEKMARERGHEIVCVIDADNVGDFDSEAFRSAECAIEFSQPAVAADNILHCFAAGVPVVSGTTGWTSRLDEMKRLCDEGKGTLLWSSNFSIGVNVFRAINRKLASLMNRFEQYSPSMVETHHIHKLDHPSGTAVTLAEEIIAETDRVQGWYEPEEGEEKAKAAKPGLLPIGHIRRDEVPGIHTIVWDSPQDTITITHDAKGREGFAVGAVIAAEWLATRSGFHTLNQMLAFD